MSPLPGKRSECSPSATSSQGFTRIADTSASPAVSIGLPPGSPRVSFSRAFGASDAQRWQEHPSPAAVSLGKMIGFRTRQGVSFSGKGPSKNKCAKARRRGARPTRRQEGAYPLRYVTDDSARERNRRHGGCARRVSPQDGGESRVTQSAGMPRRRNWNSCFWRSPKSSRHRRGTLGQQHPGP
jgi:hypothetical protein